MESLSWKQTLALQSQNKPNRVHTPTHSDGLVVPAGADAGNISQRHARAGEVTGVEYRERGVDVALHGVRRMCSIWVHRERPVVHQPWNHV